MFTNGVQRADREMRVERLSRASIGICGGGGGIQIEKIFFNFNLDYSDYCSRRGVIRTMLRLM